MSTPSKTVVEFHTDFQPRIKTTPEGEELHIYDCPFCGKEGHLYFFPANTTWDCKVCGRKGNVHVFNQMIYNDIANGNIDRLHDLWQLPKRVFKEVKYNPLNGTFIIPTFRNDKLNNLYKYVEEVNKVYGTPGLPPTLYSWTEEDHETIWLCEGQKDKLAAEAILGQGKEITVRAIPGANVFQNSWLPAFSGVDLVLLFDNDEAGEIGMKSIIEKFKKGFAKPRSIKRIYWPDDCKPGYDVHDFFLDKGKLKDINALVRDLPPEENVAEAVKVTNETVVEDYSCDSYDKALDVYSRAYHLTKDMKTALAMVMASIYSIRIEGEQLWIKIIGSPGCGKTRIAKAVSACEQVMNLSTFTGLFSGWKDDEEKDPGLVPLISNRTLIVKDADALLRQPNIEKIMSELRDFYDKDSAVHYNNRQHYDYKNVRSTFIMMGTQILRRADQSFLGERLLTLEMDVSTEDKDLISQKMLDRSIEVALGSVENPETAIMSSMKGWVNHLCDRELDATLPLDYRRELLRLCYLTAALRTQVDRDYQGKLLSPAIPELPTRLIGQTVTASLALCTVLGVNEPTEEIFQITRKTHRDTINPRSYRFVICDTILENPGITAAGVVEATGYDKSIVGMELRDLKELHFVKVAKVPGSSLGFTALGYWLKDELISTFKEITQ